MKLKRALVAVAFVALVFGLVVDLKPISAQGSCGECESVGEIKKCNGDAAVGTGDPSGNCITVGGKAEQRQNPDGSTTTVNCTVTKFYNCTAPAPTTGCPIGSGCPGSTQ